jgi:hypothetical protein
MGLHQIKQEDYVAGPWHPAFSELCFSKIFLEKVTERLKTLQKGSYNIFVCDREISVAVGQKKSNLLALSKAGYNCRIKGDSSVSAGEFIIEEA